jgi:hypothetical protein
MEKNSVLNLVAIILVVLGVVMIYIGGFYGPQIMLPPIITGVGFFAIAWALKVLKS